MTPDRDGAPARERAAERGDPEDGRADLVWPPERSERVGDFRHFRVDRAWARHPASGEALDFYILDMPDWVQVVPLTADGRFVMVEQFRHGTRRVTTEFPAGLVEPGEDPVTTAVRELEEETGYTGGPAHSVGDVDPNAALQNNLLHIVVVENCEPTGTRDQDSREHIRHRLVHPDEVDGLIARGQFRDAYGIIAWDFYLRHVRGERLTRDG